VCPKVVRNPGCIKSAGGDVQCFLQTKQNKKQVIPRLIDNSRQTPEQKTAKERRRDRVEPALLDVSGMLYPLPTAKPRLAQGLAVVHRERDALAGGTSIETVAGSVGFQWSGTTRAGNKLNAQPP
jgi:hypothetical protein